VLSGGQVSSCGWPRQVMAMSSRPHLLVSPVEDTVALWLHKRFSEEAQLRFRNSGRTRLLLDGMNYLGAGALAATHMHLLRTYISLKQKIRSYKYGSSDDELVHILPVDEVVEEVNKVLLFVHGGAWGSGHAWMYFLCALNIARAAGCSVCVVVSYPVFPNSDTLQQKTCVVRAIAFIFEMFPNREFLLSGHSSGANLCALAMLQDASHIDKLILFNGVYDIQKHYEWERSRGKYKYVLSESSLG
jgi:acetyl esterase/lipase